MDLPARLDDLTPHSGREVWELGRVLVGFRVLGLRFEEFRI